MIGYANMPTFVQNVMLSNLLKMWVPVSSTGKVSDGCIRDLGFNPRLHQKLIGILVWL